MAQERLPQPGNDTGTWGSILNDFLLVEHNIDGTLKANTTIAGKYSKPSNGIPVTDLATDLQSKINSIPTSLSTVATSGNYADLTGRPTITGSNTGDQTISLSGANLSISNGNTIVLPTGAGSAGWGAISGTLSDQTDLTTALNAKLNSNLRGVANGIASLDANGRLPLTQLGSGTPSSTTFLSGTGTWISAPTGSSGTISSANITDATTTGKSLLTAANAAAAQSTIGLANVNNTSDADKPISTATQTALNAKAATVHTHAISDVTGLQAKLDTIPRITVSSTAPTNPSTNDIWIDIS